MWENPPRSSNLDQVPLKFIDVTTNQTMIKTQLRAEKQVDWPDFSIQENLTNLKPKQKMYHF